MVKRIKLKKAPLNKRIFAYIVDWYLGSALCAMPVGWLWNVLTRELEVITDITLFEKPYGLIAGILGLIFGVIYYYVVPLKFDGQTFGKKLLGIKIVDNEGNKLSAGNLAKRQILGVMIMESSFMLSGDYVSKIISMFTFSAVGTVINYVMLATFLVSCFMVFKKGLAIHDILAHSMVIEM